MVRMLWGYLRAVLLASNGMRGNVDIRMLETCWLSLLPSVCVVCACVCVLL